MARLKSAHAACNSACIQAQSCCPNELRPITLKVAIFPKQEMAEKNLITASLVFYCSFHLTDSVYNMTFMHYFYGSTTKPDISRVQCANCQRRKATALADVLPSQRAPEMISVIARVDSAIW